MEVGDSSHKSYSNAELPFWDESLPLGARVKDLVSRLTLAEKVAQMSFDAPAVERLGILAYNWWNECLHGVARAGIATVFPQAIGLGATWNTSLMRQVAVAISDEARAKHHEAVRQGASGWYQGLTFWSPNINIFRDPRWGRGQETYGEDPYLTARLGVAFVEGLQGEDSRYLKVVATPKHYAVHSGPEFDRHHFDALVDARDLRETYLPAFEAGVREAKAGSVMGAYNRTNGEPCCASQTLLQTILRDEWGFDGYVVSDCGAIRDIYENHQVVDTPEGAAALAVKAGCDLNCGQVYPALVAAVECELITEVEIDQAVTRLFGARFRLGMFDPPEKVPFAHIPIEVNASDTHRTLSLKAARESLVLLKNEGGFLPLANEFKTIAVIGPNAHDPLVLLGNYFGMPVQSITPLMGIQIGLRQMWRVLFHQGCGILEEIPGGEAAAVELVESADVILFFGGISQQVEGEEGQSEGLTGGRRSRGDRTDLGLPEVQLSLLKSLHACGKPIVLVLLNGGPVSVPWAADHVPAILEAWYPGEQGGTAIAEGIFGDYNPGGRMPVTVHRFADDLPPFEDYAMVGRTYRYFQGEPLFPFGHGLSYTKFAYRDLILSASSMGVDESLNLSVTVSNVGGQAGEEVVQLYVSLPEASVPVPIRQLQGFERIHLAPGESRTVSFSLAPHQRSVIEDSGQRVVEPGTVHISVGGRQPTPVDDGREGGEVLFATVRITGERVAILTTQ